ncbi:hypothetical protein DTO166G4_4691 [Paecilomyces variotii]|nr:hypothetical protein DTO166G4_4691 [Paecilomyces variotii]KAJ9238200.1 hypothetical protein DTO166G5_3102 [Paecilomyces variotii]KAJ9314274.1 hypothetical protein DTO271D3_5503 [Paecilomyces variotii]KAJ9387251.1 hypothetical protein DTO063F5_3346 [Paecilomyces variotii]
MTGSSQQRWNRVSYSKFAGIDLIKDLYTTSERAEPWRGAPNSTIISNACIGTAMSPFLKDVVNTTFSDSSGRT